MIEQRFDSLVDYLRHLVDDHGIEETDSLWKSGRDRFDDLHSKCHDTANLTRVTAERDALQAKVDAVRTLDMETVARAWLAYQGYNEAGVDSLIKGGHDERCELQGYDWVCSDGETSYHPERDRFDEDAATMMFTYEALLAILTAPVDLETPKGKVE
jgi:hypothetical protein